MNTLFLQGLVFSTLVIGILAFLAWWLYLSPMRQSGSNGLSSASQSKNANSTSTRLSYALALLIGLGSLLICFGAYWDISEHVVTGIVPGVEDFLWPPHLMIYAGFLFAFLVAMGGLVALAIPNLRAGVNDPRLWVRHNPYVGAIVLIAGYGLFSIPGDAIWHELYGVDLTAWSPPHIFLAISAASLPIFAAGLLTGGGKPVSPAKSAVETRSQRNPASARLGNEGALTWRQVGSKLTTSDWLSFVKLLYIVMALNQLLIIGSIEWEIDIVKDLVAQRPVWLYPTIIGVSSFFVSALARRVVPGPWTATAFALFYFGFRIAATSFAEVMSGAPPRLTLVFILGAVLLDLTCQWMARFGFKAGDWQFRLAASGAFMVGYTLVAQPTIAFYLLPYLPSFTVPDHLLTALFVFLLNAALYPVALGLGGWLQGFAGEESEKLLEMPETVTVPAEG